MQYDGQQLQTIKQQILTVIAKHLDLDQVNVFVFGSHARKQQHKRSDFDIGLEAVNQIDPVKLIFIEEEFEKLPYLIDLVDFSILDNEFKKIAKKDIIIWNQAK